MSDNKAGRKPAVNAESILDWFIDRATPEEARALLERIQLAHRLQLRLAGAPIAVTPRVRKPKPEAPDAN